MEPAEQYAARVLAEGQEPFPHGQTIYDDEGFNANINTGYEHVEATYGFGADGPGMSIRYYGRWPKFNPAGDDYEMVPAYIHVPAWLITDPDGEERYRQQTAEMAADVRQKNAAEDARMDALIEAMASEAARDAR
jgi:hypothetical protein